jgi:hypothetical protein
LENALWEALSFAFYDSPLAQDIQSARTVEDLCNFWHGQQGQYLLVDQLNALENHHEGNKILDVLNGMGLGHHYVVSASANQITYKDSHQKQNNTAVVYFQGGMDEVCLDFLYFVFATHVNRTR